MGCVTNLDVKKLMAMEIEWRRRFGPLRYILYPFIIKDRGDVVLKVRYVQSQCEDNVICRTDCPRCRHTEPPASTSSLPSAPVSWADTVVRDRQMVSFVVSPLRHKFRPYVGAFAYFHTGDGLLHFLSMNCVGKLQQALNFTQLHINDFYILDSTPFHFITNEMVIAKAPAAATTAPEMPKAVAKAPATADAVAENQAKTEDELPLFALMEEATYDMKGPVHIKVKVSVFVYVLCTCLSVCASVPF